MTLAMFGFEVVSCANEREREEDSGKQTPAATGPNGAACCQEDSSIGNWANESWVQPCRLTTAVEGSQNGE